MPMPRKSLISIDNTPYYHFVSRCVRRTFLCSQDPLTGQSFEHRRQWILDRLHELIGSFSIDCCGYSITYISDKITSHRGNIKKINNQPIQLLPFVGNHRDNMPKGIPFNLVDYLELVDWTGRIIREDKRGHIAENLPPILDRL
jgi:hypothetical protein